MSGSARCRAPASGAGDSDGDSAVAVAVAGDANVVSTVRGERRSYNFAERQQMVERTPVSRMPFCGPSWRLRVAPRPGEAAGARQGDLRASQPVKVFRFRTSRAGAPSGIMEPRTRIRRGLTAASSRGEHVVKKTKP